MTISKEKLLAALFALLAVAGFGFAAWTVFGTVPAGTIDGHRYHLRKTLVGDGLVHDTACFNEDVRRIAEETFRKHAAEERPERSE